MTSREPALIGNLLDILFDEPGVGRCLVGIDGIVLRVNDEWLRSTGFTHDQVMGANLIELFPEFRDGALAMHARARAGHEVAALRHRQVRAGRETWWEGSIHPVAAQGGTELLITAREITAAADPNRSASTDGDNGQEVALNDKLELIDAITNSTDDVIYAKDRLGRFRFANPAMLALLGQSLEQVLGRTDEQLLEDQVAARQVMKNDRRIMERGAAMELDESIPLPDGTKRVWLSRKVPYHDAQGHVIGLLGISRDITERKQVEAERDTLAQQRQLALDAAQMGWWHHDPISKVSWYDKRYTEIYGLREATYDNSFHLIHPADASRVHAAIDAALDPAQPQPYAVEFRINRPDGELRWVEAHGLPIFDGEGSARRAIGFVGTLADITARKKAESAVNAVNEQLREAHRHKDEFLATLAHELRNPLAPILTSVELIRLRNPDDEAVRRANSIIQRQAIHLTRLVDDLLDVSRITMGTIQLRLETLDLGEIARGAVEAVRSQLDAARLTLDLQISQSAPIVRGDATRLAQCITNLLTNAIKFTRAGGRLSLHVAQEGPMAVVEVTDSGTGIAAANLERIFEMFVQEHPTGWLGNTGLGIGLALTRKLVALHGGTVHAASGGQDQGSTFRIELPALGASRNGLAPANGVHATDEGAARVLVVDDNLDAADTMGAMLAMRGFNVTVEYTGEAAVRAVEQQGPDAVLLDIGLPGIDGYEACRRIRSSGRASQPVVIALTGWGQAKDRELAAAAGFDAHLTKPAEPDQVIALLKQRLATAG
jgi:PAS domain S-box-containing protein